MMLTEDKTKKRDGFIFPFRWIETLKEATADEFRQMIEAASKYAERDEDTPFEDRYLRGVWNEFKSRLDYDGEKFKNICERNRENIKKRWSNDTTVYDRKKSYTKNTDIEGEVEGEVEGKKRDTAPSFKQWTEQQFIDEVRKHPEHSDIAAEFIGYWTETDGKGKMRFQAQKFFEVKKRLASWRKNNFSRSQGGNTQTPQTASELKTFDAF